MQEAGVAVAVKKLCEDCGKMTPHVEVKGDGGIPILACSTCMGVAPPRIVVRLETFLRMRTSAAIV